MIRKADTPALEACLPTLVSLSGADKAASATQLQYEKRVILNNQALGCSYGLYLTELDMSKEEFSDRLEKKIRQKYEQKKRSPSKTARAISTALLKKREEIRKKPEPFIGLEPVLRKGLSRFTQQGHQLWINLFWDDSRKELPKWITQEVERINNTELINQDIIQEDKWIEVAG